MIEAWKVIDRGTDDRKATVEEGLWRIPVTTEEEREQAFDTDRLELERLGKAKANLGLWPAEGVLHFYQPQALILGKLDRRMANEEAAFRWAKEEEVPLVLRIAGGQAIVSDAGVLNVSILTALPDQKLSIDEGFRKMANCIQDAFEDLVTTRLGFMPEELKLEIGEIKRSYCPGDYDLSAFGLKVCGIAQRRVRNAVGLMAYISVDGDQAARANLVRQFYDIGEAGPNFPASDPNVMATLNDIYKRYLGEEAIHDNPITVDELKQSILRVLGVKRNSVEAVLETKDA